jgi:hypothetical protein
MGSPCCLYVCMCIPPIVARQWLGKHYPEATNTHVRIEKVLDASSMRSVKCQRNVGD